MQGLGTPQQTFGGPFAHTRNAIARRYQGQTGQQVQNTLGQQGAELRQNQAQFGNQQAWATWGGKLSRAAQDIQAREAINQQNLLAYNQRKQAKKSARRGLFGSAVGTLGGVAGTFLGGQLGGGGK